MHRKTKAKIYLNRIQENVQKILKGAHANKVCMMVKANAYGHGLVPVVKALETRVNSFGIISIEEGQEVRAENLSSDLWLFSNLWKDSIVELERNNITPVIGDRVSLEHFLSSESKIPFHLKFNTGMNRFGFRLEEMTWLNKVLSGREKQIEGIATHMLDGNSFKEDENACLEQLKLFQKFLDRMSICHDLKLHLYKSAPALLNGDSIADEKMIDWIRPGIASYGVYPEKGFPKEQTLRPAMELSTRIVGLQTIQAGEGVSYAGTWVAKKESLIGICQIGYADGLLRNLSNHLNVLVGGQLVPQVGNICMDYCMIDLTKVRDNVGIGDEVVIFGSQSGKIQAVEDVAALGNTIPYELLTSISPRVGRQYILDES